MSEIATHRLTPVAWARLVVADAFEPTAVRNTTTTTGTGALTIGAAVSGYADIDDVYAVDDVFEGAVTDGTDWEFGYYTLQAGSIVARSRITASTNDGAAVNFAAGTKTFIANVRDAARALLFYLAALVRAAAAGTLTGATLAAGVTASSLNSLGTISQLVATLATFSTTIGVGGATPAASGAGVTFPATQDASTNANTLDDYEEGTATLVLTFATPGTLNVVYSAQLCEYTKIGRKVAITCNIGTSTFTNGTASGNLQLTGLPFTHMATTPSTGAARWQGITKTCNDIASIIAASTSIIEFRASTSAAAISAITAAETTSGTQITLNCGITYFV